METINRPIAGKINALINESASLNHKKDKTASLVATQAVKLAEENQSHFLQIKALVTLSTAYCDTLSNYPKALEICEQAYKLAVVLGDKSSMVRVLSNFGLCYHYTGDLEASHQYFRKAISLAEENKTPTKEELKGLGSLYYNIAVLFKTKEFAHLRISYLDRVLQIYTQTEYTFGIARAYNAYSAFYAHNNEYDLALKYQQKSLVISEEIGDKYGVAISYNNIGSVLVDKKDFKKGLEYLQLALELKLELGNKHSIAESYLHLGLAYRDMEQLNLAISNFHTAEKLLLAIDSKIFLNEIYIELGKAYASLANFEAAYKYQVRFTDLQKDLMKFDTTTAILEAQAKNELEKKEEETVLLRQKNIEIKEYTQQLIASNNELKQFAHVASHDLKEPLRMISSYISLVEKKASHKLNEEEIQFLNFAVEGAKRLDALINDLLTLSKVTACTKTESIDLNLVLKDAIINVSKLKNESKTEMTYDKLPTIQGDKTQLIQVFQNLLSNAIKYNKSITPKIVISHTYKDNSNTISIKDNGIGIPEQHRERIFILFQRLHRRDEYSGNGIGLAICRKIVDHMKGDIWVEENATGGSIFYLRFSANPALSLDL